LEGFVAKQAKKLKQAPNWKLLLWTAIAGLVFGFIGFGEIAEDALRSARNSLHRHKASGDIALVLIDDRSLHAIGNWPWPRREDALLIDGLAAARTRSIFVDINLSFPTERGEDEALATSIRNAGMVTLFSRSQVGVNTAARKVDGRPLAMFADHARLALASYDYNYQSAVWRLPWSGKVNGEVVPSFAAALAGRGGPPGTTFPVDY
jgi:CHASE2 domain-containing sensor protein